jgi:hypothetical protein
MQFLGPAKNVKLANGAVLPSVLFIPILSLPHSWQYLVWSCCLRTSLA